MLKNISYNLLWDFGTLFLKNSVLRYLKKRKKREIKKCGKWVTEFIYLYIYKVINYNTTFSVSLYSRTFFYTIMNQQLHNKGKHSTTIIWMS